MIKRALRNVWSPERRNRRNVDVYLPDAYFDTRARYSVVYMHDGQNLSDPQTAFAGTWELERTLASLGARGLEPIVVGIDNTGDQRLAEYSPFPDRRHGGGDADAYLTFLTATLKPRIDRTFRTRPGRETTAIFGSSMGGLVSLYAYFRFPMVFARAGAMSPSIWFGQGTILDFIEAARTPSGRLYLDIGTEEGAGTLRDARRAGRLLVRKGFARDRPASRRQAAAVDPERTRADAKPLLRYVEQGGGRHNEADWAVRLEGALEFLLR